MKNSLLANVNARLDSFIGQVAEFKDRLDTSEKDTHELKENLEFSQEDIMDLKPCSCRIHEVEEEIEMMCVPSNIITLKRLYIRPAGESK